MRYYSRGFQTLKSTQRGNKTAPRDLLEACELFAEEMNDHDAEDEAGEHSEESGDACDIHKGIHNQVSEMHMNLPMKASVGKSKCTEHVLGAELPQVFELHVDVDDGCAPGER